MLSNGKAVSVSTTVETVYQNTLEAIPQTAVFRDPERTRHPLPAIGHRWRVNVVENLGVVFYFVNLSEYPVQVGMCQDDRPNCTNAILPSTVAPMASISFPIDESRKYAVIESTPGYSVATTLRFTDGTRKVFEASSCIKFEGSASCSSGPPSRIPSTAKLITPLVQQTKTNSEAAMSSPAALATPRSDPQKLAELVKNGQASKCVVVTQPVAADVYVDGLHAAVTPVVFVLLKKADTPRTVEIRMDGYRTIQKQVIPDGHLITIQATLEKQ